MKARGCKPAPRVGLRGMSSATAARRSAAVGDFFDRHQDDIILSLVEQPPLMDTRTTSFTTIPQLQNSQLIQSPRSVFAFAPFEVPTVYNWSIGVQRSLPWT